MERLPKKLENEAIIKSQKDESLLNTRGGEKGGFLVRGFPQ